MNSQDCLRSFVSLKTKNLPPDICSVFQVLFWERKGEDGPLPFSTGSRLSPAHILDGPH